MLRDQTVNMVLPTIYKFYIGNLSWSGTSRCMNSPQILDSTMEMFVHGSVNVECQFAVSPVLQQNTLDKIFM